MDNNLPATRIHPKVAAAGLAGAAATVLIWIGELAGVEVTPEVAAAITTIVAFAAGYLKTGLNS
jgi:hypothetical protein